MGYSLKLLTLIPINNSVLNYKVATSMEHSCRASRMELSSSLWSDALLGDPVGVGSNPIERLCVWDNLGSSIDTRVWGSLVSPQECKASSSE